MNANSLKFVVLFEKIPWRAGSQKELLYFTKPRNREKSYSQGRLKSFYRDPGPTFQCNLMLFCGGP